MVNLVKQYSTLTSGTITIVDTKQDIQLIHNESSLAATLTINFPATPTDGQIFSIASILGVTLLTLFSTLSIVAAITSLAAGGFASYMYDITANKWIRIA